MSDTTEKPEAAAQPPEEPAPAPAEAEQSQPEEQAEREQKEDRRWARNTARLAALTRENHELTQRLAQVEAARNGQAQAAPLDPQLQQLIDQESNRKLEERMLAEKIRTFHEAGREAYPDWRERCDNLQAMGAIPISSLMVEMPNGAKVAAALHDDPEELAHILSIPTERGRSIALGQFEAKLAARSVRPVSKAPKPPAIVTQRTAPQFDPYSASTEQLLKEWSKPGARPP